MNPNDLLKCTLAPSKIHGIGVFAIVDVKKGEKMYCLTLEPRVYKSEVLENVSAGVWKIVVDRWPGAVDGHSFRIDDVRLISFMNHSDTPNYDKHNDVAFVDIKKGEEVTEDYGKYKDILITN